MRAIHLLSLAAVCHGAAIPIPGMEQFDMDLIIDTFQDFVADPSPYMEAMGARPKRHADEHHDDDFKEFNLPFLGVEVGVKYKDPAHREKGGEAFLHIDDLQSHIPAAHSKMVKIHTKFDGGPDAKDGLFEMSMDYHLEHKDGDGVEEGTLMVIRRKNGDKWATTIKTNAKPFSGVTIIPSKFAGIDIELESDRKTNLHGHYKNPGMNRDMKIDVVRVPGESITINTERGGVKSKIVAVMTKPSNNEREIKIDADIRGTKLSGEISGKYTNGDLKLKIELEKGAEKLMQVQLEVKGNPQSGKFRGKYSMMGGRVAQGKFSGVYDKGAYVFEAAPYKMEVNVKLGKSLLLIASKDDVEMWSYKSNRENKSNDDAIIFEASSEMKMNKDSKLYGMVEKYYKFGPFEKRTNVISVFVDKKNRNAILRKFKIDFEVIKDGSKVIHLAGDTTSTPYKFILDAPNFLERIGSTEDIVEVTVNHQKGKSLTVESNIRGGLKFALSHTPNTKGGRHISVSASKAGEELLSYEADTEKHNDDEHYHIKLDGALKLSENSMIYNKLVRKYKILTPFKVRNSHLEFKYDKINKNVAMGQWFAKAKIDKDGANVLDLDISTATKPYKFYVFCPAILGKFRPNMEKLDMTLEHIKGEKLELKVLHPGAKFVGFKISKTGSGSEREIVWNGKALGKGDYALTDKSFTTNQALADGRTLKTTITWLNKFDSPAFWTHNKVSVDLDGSERSLDLDMEWDMAHLPDFNFATPESGSFKMNAVGQNKRWGNYKISRDIKWNVANKIFKLDEHGEAEFDKGFFADRSPVLTEVSMSYNQPEHDLEGKFMKNFAGREYSITFPKGSMVAPTIKMGA